MSGGARASRDDWARFDAEAIPSKSTLGPLEHWLDGFAEPAGQRLLDLGCGVGLVSSRLRARGFAVIGVDINADALLSARQACPDARFFERDIAAATGLSLPESGFSGVVCQLVFSIIGDAAERAQLLANAHAMLQPGGRLFASFSGVSGDLNPEYARLYADDFALTGEHATYLSRDAAGRVLYRTHHFSRAEISALLGEPAHRFERLELSERVEASSRRPDQRARFFYATCRRA
jgi:SAM-dependent methyltransferase